uniref:Gag-Pro-Pol polyprotein n=1 Tax=Lygus hesperus TaxID=30085 RepID=A0A0A9Y9I4_LYGHE
MMLRPSGSCASLCADVTCVSVLPPLSALLLSFAFSSTPPLSVGVVASTGTALPCCVVAPTCCAGLRSTNSNCKGAPSSFLTCTSLWSMCVGTAILCGIANIVLVKCCKVCAMGSVKYGSMHWMYGTDGVLSHGSMVVITRCSTHIAMHWESGWYRTLVGIFHRPRVLGASKHMSLIPAAEMETCRRFLSILHVTPDTTRLCGCLIFVSVCGSMYILLASTAVASAPTGVSVGTTCEQAPLLPDNLVSFSSFFILFFCNILRSKEPRMTRCARNRRELRYFVSGVRCSSTRTLLCNRFRSTR